MIIYKCDRCKKEINEDDVCTIRGFGDGNFHGDFCEACSDEWDTMLMTLKDAFLKQQTIRIEEKKDD